MFCEQCGSELNKELICEKCNLVHLEQKDVKIINCTICGAEATGSVCMKCGCLVRGNKPQEKTEEGKLIKLYFIGYFCLAMLGIAIVASILATFKIIISGLELNPETIVQLTTDYTFILQLFVEAILLFFFIKVAKKTLSLDQIKGKNIPKLILMTFGISIIFLGCNLLIGNLMALIPGMDESTNQDLIAHALEVAPISIVFSAVIFAPIVEELVFRGGIYNFFEKKINTKAAILISGAIFGSLHVLTGLMGGNLLELLHFITYFVMGCGFGLIYAKTKNIYVCIGVHFINNLISVILMFVAMNM